MVELRQVQPDHVLEQHEGVLAGRCRAARTKRGTTWPGMWITASAACGSDATARPAGARRPGRATRLPRYGNGWPGSMASGVSTGQQRPAEVVLEEPRLLRR